MPKCQGPFVTRRLLLMLPNMLGSSWADFYFNVFVYVLPPVSTGLC